MQKRYVSSIAIMCVGHSAISHETNRSQCRRVESGVIYSAAILTFLILGVIPFTYPAADPTVDMLAQIVVSVSLDKRGSSARFNHDYLGNRPNVNHCPRGARS
jgi:hypothetical protein